MLTREQKIDFLKCCIAAYEHEKVTKFGFCYFFAHYEEINKIGNGRYDNFQKKFPEFYAFIFKKSINSQYVAGYNKIGFEHRVKLARQFLKSEYGIEV